MRTCLLLGAAALVLGQLDPVLALDPARDKTLYVVADAHLDTEWNWTIQNTINSYIPATLQTNFAFFAKYPHYTFSFKGSFRYRLAREYYPADYLCRTARPPPPIASPSRPGS